MKTNIINRFLTNLRLEYTLDGVNVFVMFWLQQGPPINRLTFFDCSRAPSLVCCEHRNQQDDRRSSVPLTRTIDLTHWNPPLETIAPPPQHKSNQTLCAHQCRPCCSYLTAASAQPLHHVQVRISDLISSKLGQKKKVRPAGHRPARGCRQLSSNMSGPRRAWVRPAGRIFPWDAIQ